MAKTGVENKKLAYLQLPRQVQRKLLPCIKMQA